MSVATGVDVARSRSTGTTAVQSSAIPGRTEIAMTPIAAYYVMVVTDHENRIRKPRYESVVPRTSLIERIAVALETLVRLGRPSTTQPI